MPPLLKSLSTRATNPIRNLVLLSKSERFCGLGAGLMHLSMLSPTYPLPGVMGEMVGI